MDLQLEHINLSSTVVGDQEPTTREVDARRERVALEFAKALPAGSKAKLDILYHGALTGNLAGYYRSHWVKEDGVTHSYALTQFEVRSRVSGVERY